MYVLYSTNFLYDLTTLRTWDNSAVYRVFFKLRTNPWNDVDDYEISTKKCYKEQS